MQDAVALGTQLVGKRRALAARLQKRPQLAAGRPLPTAHSRLPLSPHFEQQPPQHVDASRLEHLQPRQESDLNKVVHGSLQKQMPIGQLQ